MTPEKPSSMTEQTGPTLNEELQDLLDAIGAWIRSGDGKKSTVKADYLVKAEEIVTRALAAQTSPCPKCGYVTKDK